jgi:type II secretory pathway pseudopilin PulG
MKNRRRKGITIIDTLVAVLIMTVAMVGSIGIFFAASTMTTNTETNTLAESLARWSIEQAKSQGFDWCSTSTAGTENSAPCDGTTTAYYNNLGAALPNSTGAVFSVTTTVASNPAPSGGVVSQSALRTVTVTVNDTATGKTLLTTATYLTWGGV